MENFWIFFVVSYGLLKGIRECVKKEALKTSSLMEVLFLYMLVGFVFTLPDAKSALECEPVFILKSLVKAVVVCLGFIMSFIAIRGLPIGFYSIMTLSQMVFTTLISVVFLGENFGILNFVALVMVIGGLVLLNIKKQENEDKGIKLILVFTVLAYTLCNSISSVMDKVLTKSMTPGQLQFWFMFFSVIFYGVIIIVKKQKISIKTLKTNFWIPLMGFMLAFGDRLLFIANASSKSKVTVMTLLLQCSVVVTIILGRVIYKEKQLLYKLFCAGIIIAGIVVGTL